MYCNCKQFHAWVRPVRLKVLLIVHLCHSAIHFRLTFIVHSKAGDLEQLWFILIGSKTKLECNLFNQINRNNLKRWNGPFLTERAIKLFSKLLGSIRFRRKKNFLHFAWSGCDQWWTMLKLVYANESKERCASFAKWNFDRTKFERNY